jgi:hypothetical protein
MRSVRWSVKTVSAVAAVAVTTGTLALVGVGSPASAAPTDTPVAGCQLNSPGGKVQHVIHLTFDNVHFTRDNPNVPSDLEQMPNLLNFLKNNGTLLSNMHTPLIAHTADDILTTLTGVYGDKHGQPVSNSYRVFNTSGTTSSASSFAYWTDPVAANTTDTTPTMVTKAGKIAPAPWVPFTKAGCDVGGVSTANIEVENPKTDIPTIFGPTSPQEAEVLAQIKQFGFADQAAADYEGIAVHCANTSTSVCANNPNAAPDQLPDQPSGYQGFQALYGNKYVGTVIGGTATPTGVQVNDYTGAPLTNYYASQDVKGTYYGFPGFSVTATQTLAYIAGMQEHGIPVTYGYISDEHGNFGPGDARYEAQLKADDTAFGTFFADLSAHGITPANTLFEISSDEGDHYAGAQLTGCDGVTTPCVYQPGQVGEVNINLAGLLAQETGDLGTDFNVHADSAPNFYITGQPGASAARVRQIEQELLSLTAPDPYANGGTGGTIPVVNQIVDQTEQANLHMVTGDPNRTPTFTVFANPDFFVNLGKTTCTGPSGAQTGTSNPCVVIDPAYAWNHGDFAPEINTNWSAFTGPGIAVKGVDSKTWADETDVRSTILALTGLKDDIQLDGRVLTQDLTSDAIPPALRQNSFLVTQLGNVYKQLNACVGSFGSDTIAVSAAAVQKTDPTAYADLDQKLADLGTQRDAVAGQIASVLSAASFDGAPVPTDTGTQLLFQGLNVLIKARLLNISTTGNFTSADANKHIH